jgi:hypothetical protein
MIVDNDIRTAATAGDGVTRPLESPPAIRIANAFSPPPAGVLDHLSIRGFDSLMASTTALRSSEVKMTPADSIATSAPPPKERDSSVAVGGPWEPERPVNVYALSS